jgi:hypothetical protein
MDNYRFYNTNDVFGEHWGYYNSISGYSEYNLI